MSIISRKWMIIDEKGSFKTQRQLPKMVLIKLSYTNDHLVLEYPNKGSINIPLTPPMDKIVKCRHVKYEISHQGCKK